MLLSSGHVVAVPPDFFLHPQTGRVAPIAGSVAYDPDSAALVFTTDSSAGTLQNNNSYHGYWSHFQSECHKTSLFSDIFT